MVFLQAAANGGAPLAATGSAGPWAAGSLHIGPFLPQAALWLHDLWLRLCEKVCENGCFLAIYI
eukprot:COSAG06_NODE_1136_length_10570_cov_6.459555_3_plen_64_part_00